MAVSSDRFEAKEDQPRRLVGDDGGEALCENLHSDTSEAVDVARAEFRPSSTPSSP